VNAIGENLGTVTTFYELPQGLMLDINTRRGSVLIPYRPESLSDGYRCAHNPDQRYARLMDPLGSEE